MTLVSEAMNRSIVTIGGDARAQEAALVARRAGAQHLLVMDSGNLIGILCTCDLDGADPGELVCDRMTLPVLTVRPDATIEDVATTMNECEVGCLHVVCGGLILGTLTEHELHLAGVRRVHVHHRCRGRRGKMPHA